MGYVLSHQTAADGDLSFRLSCFGTDGFQFDCPQEIDRCADNMSEMVSAIGKCTTLSLASDEFNQQAATSDELIGFQHQFLDSVAVAMAQMTSAIEEVSINASNTSLQTKKTQPKCRPVVGALIRQWTV